MTILKKKFNWLLSEKVFFFIINIKIKIFTNIKIYA